MKEVLSSKDLCNLVSNSRVTLVAGMTDTGKSTLVRRLAMDARASIIDSDIGQSDFGPPSVVSLARYVDNQVQTTDGYFVGSVNPVRHFLQLLTGVSRMAQTRDISPVIINTTGLVVGDIGRSLLTEKINALSPDLIIGLEKGTELAYLNAFQRCGGEVIRLQPAPEVRVKTVSERSMLRAKAFQKHFNGAETKCLLLDDIGIERSLLNNGVLADPAVLPSGVRSNVLHIEVSGDEAFIVFRDKIVEAKLIASTLGITTMHAVTCADFTNLLLGTMGPDGKFIGLGIIRSIDFKHRVIEIITNASDISVIQLGTMKLDPVTFSTAGQFRPTIFHA